MKRILITGGKGFIGRCILDLLAHNNDEIHATFSKEFPLELEKKVKWHKVNLEDPQSVQAFLKEITPTHLIHLAWYTNPQDYWTSYINLQWFNLSLHLLQMFIKNGGKRAVFVGSCAEYNWKYSHCHEFDTPCLPSSLYGSAKHSLYLLSNTLSKEKKISFAWARLFFLFGAYEHKKRLFPSLVNHLLTKKVFEIKNGYQVRDFMPVTEAAKALVSLFESSVEGPVNIASGKGITINELVSIASKKLNLEYLINSRQINSCIQHSVVTADINRLMTEVKWQPTYQLNDAIEHTITWWKENL